MKLYRVRVQLNADPTQTRYASRKDPGYSARTPEEIGRWPRKMAMDIALWWERADWTWRLEEVDERRP